MAASDGIIEIPPLEIIYQDVFNLKMLYRAMHLWLDEEEFWDDNQGHNYIEVLYLEMRRELREYRVWWRTRKNILSSKYYRFLLEVDFQVLNCSDVEVMYKGQKVKGQSAELTLRFRGKLETDFNKKLREHWLASLLARPMRRFVMYREIEARRLELYRYVYAFHDYCKRYLELKSFLPGIETFHEQFDEI